MLLGRKGYPERRRPTAYISTKTQRVAFHHFGLRHDEPDLRWVWTPDRVWIERADGCILDSRDEPRQHFSGYEYSSVWDDLDVLYFSGYALWNYFLAPYYFSWPQFSTRELDSHSKSGKIWRVLEVTYPDHFPTHCKVQKYYFDDHHQLRRLDYYAEVTKGMAAHYCFDEKEIEGLFFPMLRRVLRNIDGETPGGPSMVLLNIHSIVLRHAA